MCTIEQQLLREGAVRKKMYKYFILFEYSAASVENLGQMARLKLTCLNYPVHNNIMYGIFILPFFHLMLLMNNGLNGFVPASI